MAARTPLRHLLAPIALAAVLVAAVVVVASSDGDSPTEKRATATTQARRAPVRRTYVVRQGDTLLAISNRTGVPSARLIALNPGLDPQVLQPGDRIKIRP